MKTGIRTLFTTLAATVVVCAGQASASFISQFDALPAGSEAGGMNGWKGWNGDASAVGVVSSDQSYSGANSLLIQGYTDAVQVFSGATSGQWTLSAMQYIPSGQKGLQYFIMLNSYADGGMNNAGMWSTQLKFDLKKGTVVDDFRGGSMPIVFDRWTNLRIDIDLDANTVHSYYGDVLLSEGSWTRNKASRLEVAALDLYSADKNRAYYDDISFTQIPAPSAAGAAVIAFAAIMIPTRRHRFR